MNKTSLVAIAVVDTLAYIGLDLWTKQVFFISPLSTSFSFLHGLIQQIDHHNYGITANVPIPQPLIVFVTALALVYFFHELRLAIQAQNIFTVVFLDLLIAGALGNLFDRVTLGFVRDWILLFSRSAINVADMMIAIGLVGWIVGKSSLSSRAQPRDPSAS